MIFREFRSAFLAEHIPLVAAVDLRVLVLLVVLGVAPIVLGNVVGTMLTGQVPVPFIFAACAGYFVHVDVLSDQ